MGIGGLVLTLTPLVLIMLFALPDQADAQKNLDVGITLSKTCQTMLKNNFETNCPSYEEIEALFPDTSNQDISGKLTYVDGFYSRDFTNYKNHYNWYSYSGAVTWIDPPGDIVGRIATITIESSLPEYKVKESQSLINNTLIVGHSRYVDDMCYRASITAEDWILLTGDTLQYLQKDCNPEFTNYNHLKSKTFEYTYHDITTSYKYQLDSWIEQVKKDCLGLCKEY